MPNASTVRSLTLAGAAILLVLGATPANAVDWKGPWILTCDMETAPGAHTPTNQRVFRLAPKLFQERRPGAKDWGGNLCASFPCVTNANRLEGVISSSTLVLTIRLDRKTRLASWSTQGASGLTRTSGRCTVEAESSDRSAK
jgi:hypothetical protein